MVNQEICENCGLAIGNLEPAMLWEDRIVCAACHQRLESFGRDAPMAQISYATPAPIDPTEGDKIDMTLPAGLVACAGLVILLFGIGLSDENAAAAGLVILVAALILFTIASGRSSSARGSVICPNANCGYIGAPLRKAKASQGLGCLLMLFAIVPGLLYFAFMSGYRYFCPRCGCQIRSD